jgi:cell division transport system ATP-binding protein
MLIDYKNINIYQQDGQLVLGNVNFHVDEGEFIYIIGRVGSGKSSLLKTIYFELDVNEGESAIVLNHDLRNMKQKHIPALRRQMGIIFQDFQLLGDRTIYQNLLFVLKATGWKSKAEIDQRIKDVLTDVDMQDKAGKYPHELSGGEQQRIAIARATLNKPKLIVADEPTGNLDPETAGTIIQLLRQISQTGTAIVMSTHNMPLLDKYPGIVYQCIDGRVEEISTDFNKVQIAEDTEQETAMDADYSAREDLSV